MTQDFDSQSGLIQSDNSSPSEAVDSLNTTASNPKMPTDIVSQPSVSHLKLVVSKKPGKKASKLFASSLKLVASSGISAPVYKSAPVKSSTFTAEVRKRSPYDFTMIAHDPFHYLRCELPLKFEETEEALSLICQFPTIGDDQLVDFIDDDESLLGIVLVSFHMHILQNLFLFSAAHQVKNIIVKTTEEQFKGLGIHEELIRHVDKIPTKKGIAIEMTIPVHSDSLTLCDELMEDMTAQFRKTLWQEQKANPAIRDYLKTNVRFSVAH